jgi:hypothetical protein
MATTKQIEANKHNAKLSPGPTSVLGKARSSMNALKTGVFAKHLLLPDDNAEEFGRLRLELYGEWQPTGPTEKSLVERLVALLWRQQRIYRAEAGLYEMYRRCPDGVGGVATALARDGQDTEAFTRLHRMDRGIEHSIAVIIGLLQKLQKERGTRKGLVLEPALCRGAPTAPSSPKSAGASDGDVPQI